MNLTSALECITNSNSIHKLDAGLVLSNDIASDKINWSNFDNLVVLNTTIEKPCSIDKITSFNGTLTLQSILVNKLSGNMKGLKTSGTTYGTTFYSGVSFENNTSIKDISFRTADISLLDDSAIPAIDNAIINYTSNKPTENNFKGLLSKTKNILVKDNSLKYSSPKQLGYLTACDEFNTNWATVEIENYGSILDYDYVIPKDFYSNLILYVAEDFYSPYIYKRSHLKLDYISGFAPDEDEEGYANIVVPATLTKDYVSGLNSSSTIYITFPDDTVRVALGDYCFGGIGSKAEGDKDRCLYLTFDDTFIFDISDTGTNEDGAAVETKKSIKPFTENTFLARPDAIQKIHINLQEKRPEDDLDIQNLYFSDFFTTCTKTTTTVDNGDGTTSENVETTFEFDEESFNSYKNQLLAMVGGVADNLIFNSQYEDIEAYIDVDA